MRYSKKSNFNHVARYLIRLSFLASIEVFSDQVSQRSASDYYFSRPNLPSNIQGRVIGEVPEYDILRSEDIAWLREAYAERWAFAGNFSGLSTNISTAPIFGEWDMSLKDDKRYAGWVSATKPNGSGGLSTNIVVLYKPVTNVGEGVDSAWQKKNTVWGDNNLSTKYLDPDDKAYISDAKAWRDDTYGSSYHNNYVDKDWGHTVITNIYEENVTFPAISNMMSTISMTMTNGTVCVFTNTWKEFYTTNATFIRTNHIYRGHSLINMIFTNRVVSHYGREMPSGKLHGLIDVSFFTNHYAYLKGLTRIEKDVRERNNEKVKMYYHGFGRTKIFSLDLDEQYNDYYTNHTSNFGECTIIRSNAEYLQWYYSPPLYENPTVKGQDIYVNNEFGKGDGELTYVVNNAGALLYPNGTIDCVKKAKLYAKAYAHYVRGYNYGHESDDKDTYYYPEHLDYTSFSTSFVWSCVVPIGNIELKSDGGTNVTFRIGMGSAMEQAWSATGAPSLPDEGPIELDFECPEPKKTKKDGIWHTAKGCTSSFDRYELYIYELLLIIDLEPRTMLESWKTEE